MSIKKNFMYNIIYQILVVILPLITTPYISRVVGVEGVGTFSYTSSIVAYFIMFTMLGVNNYGNRSIAAIREDKYELSKTFWEIYGLQFILAIVMISFYLLYITFFVQDNKVISYVQTIAILSALLDINWFFFGLEKFKLTVSRNIVIKLCTVIAMFIFVRDRNDLTIYVFIIVASNFISNFILWLFIKNDIVFIKIGIKDILKHFKPNLVLFIPVIAVSIYKTMDKVMLGKMADMTQVGFFENTEKVINIPMGVIVALGTVMLPRMSNLASKNEVEKSEKYIHISIVFVMCISCAITFGLMAVGPKFAPLFFGDEFSYCGILIKYMALTVIFISWANVIRTQYLIPNKKDNILISSLLAGAVINVICNILFIPKYSSLGAVIGTILAEFTVMLIQTIAVRKDLQIGKYIKESFIFIISGILMYVALEVTNFGIESDVISIIIDILLGAVVYINIIFIYFIFVKKVNKECIRNILNRR